MTTDGQASLIQQHEDGELLRLVRNIELQLSVLRDQIEMIRVEVQKNSRMLGQAIHDGIVKV
jgi:hypothetical protein